MLGKEYRPFDLDRIPPAPRERGERPLVRLVRVVVFGLACLAILWGAARNHDRVIRDLNARSAAQDQTGTLTDQDRAFLLGFVDSLRERYGVTCRVGVLKDGYAPPERDPKAMQVVIAPGAGRAGVAFPPLMDRALGPDLAPELAARLERAAAQGRWPEELKDVLITVWERLSALDPARPANATSETR